MADRKRKLQGVCTGAIYLVARSDTSRLGLVDDYRVLVAGIGCWHHGCLDHTLVSVARKLVFRVTRGKEMDGRR